MKKIYWLLTYILLALTIPCKVSSKIRDTSYELKARQKRFLLFQEGINWVQMVVGIGFPVELRHESVTWGATVKSFYLLPTNSSDFLSPTIDIARKTRSITRWKIYSTIETFMNKFNFGNGKTCILRAICDAALIPLDEKSGIMAELIHILLTPSSTKENVERHTDFEYYAAEKFGKEVINCKTIFPDCNSYLLDEISKRIL